MVQRQFYKLDFCRLCCSENPRSNHILITLADTGQTFQAQTKGFSMKLDLPNIFCWSQAKRSPCITQLVTLHHNHVDQIMLMGHITIRKY